MAAIKKLVFEDKKYTLEELNMTLVADFEGFDQVKADCLAAPKYGNDDDYVDYFTSWILLNLQKKSTVDMKTLYSILSHGTFVTFKQHWLGQTWEHLLGRRAWMPLSDGISPDHGMDTKGPAAIIKSVSKMVNENMNIGLVQLQDCAGLLDTLKVKIA